MKRILSILLLMATLLSAFSITAFADDNATGGDGTTHGASDGYGWYNTNEFMWKVTLFVGKSDQATKQSSLTNDFYRIGTVIMKRPGCTFNSNCVFGNATKIDYYGGTTMSLISNPSVIVDDANVPKIPITHNGKVVYTEYVDYPAYGVKYHTATINVGSATGSIPITARVNWQNHLSEVNISNNETETKYVTVKPKIDLSIEAIAPNSDYREGMTVVTSFTMHNNSKHDITPSYGNTVKFVAYYYSGSSKTVISEQTWYQAVIPANDTNLVYFKWTVPKIAGKNVYCEAEINADGTVDEYLNTNNKDVLVRTVASVTESQTPDTQYERQKPTGYSIPSVPTAKAGSTTWSMWEYSSGSFKKKTYGVAISSTAPSVTPDKDSPSAVYDGGRWKMKSGYGFTVSYAPAIVSVDGTTKPTSSAYTEVQRAEAFFPEFKYSTAQNSFRTLEKASGKWQFEQNEYADGKERIPNRHRQRRMPNDSIMTRFFPSLSEKNYTRKKSI